MSTNGVTSSDLAWLAGLWDGEGSIGIQRGVANSRPNLRPALQMSMTHEPTIDHVRGLCAEVGVTALGYTYAERSPHHKDAHYLHLNRMQEILLLGRLVRPFAVTKAQQWDLMIEFCDLRIAACFGPNGRLLPAWSGRNKLTGRVRQGYSDREWDIFSELFQLNHRRTPKEVS